MNNTMNNDLDWNGIATEVSIVGHYRVHLESPELGRFFSRTVWREDFLGLTKGFGDNALAIWSDLVEGKAYTYPTREGQATVTVRLEALPKK